MHSGPKLISHVALVMGAMLSIACGGTMAFQGQNSIAVVGTPPAPPPPPPPPEGLPPPVGSTVVEIPGLPPITIPLLPPPAPGQPLPP